MKTIVMLTAASLIVLSGMASHAQAQCVEGRTSAGQCIDPAMGEAARQRGVIYSQPKISTTAYPIMPLADYRYRYPNELNPNPLPTTPVGTAAPN
jgi:hypothetical protein